MKRFFLTLCAAFVATQSLAFDPADMNTDEKAAFDAAVRAYLLENPEVIMEAVAVLEQREAANQAAMDFALVEAYAEQIFNDGYSYVGGNLEGDITVVEFLDYRCGYCRRAHPEVEALIENDGNIRYIIKEFPILGEESMLAAQFAIAVKHIYGLDAYKAVSDALMAYRGDISPASLERLALDFELDPAQIMPQMASDAVAAEIQDTRTLAGFLQITGTPTFVMHDEMLRGYVPLDGMRAIVADKRG